MNIKLGLVGVGNHGRTMAHACITEGAEIAAYDRRKPDPVYGYGKRMHWQDMLSKRSGLDGILVMADPATSTEITIEAVKKGVPVLATKPLHVAEYIGAELKAPFFVDHWRLWSPSYTRSIVARVREHQHELRRVRVKTFGNGPKRNFSSAFDYGWHAMAFVFDLLGIGCNTLDEMTVKTVQVLNKPDGRQLFSVDLAWKKWPGSGAEGLPVEVVFGNGAEEKKFEIEIEVNDSEGRLSKTHRVAWPHEKDVGLQNMVSGFLRQIHDHKTMYTGRDREFMLTYEVNRALNTILRAADDHR